MSYPSYPLPQPATTFPYGTYHPPPGAYGQPLSQATPGTTAYATAYPSGYPTGVTGYGTWPGYAYSYAPGSQQPHIQSGGASRPFVHTAGVTSTASTTTSTLATPRTTTFTSYTPSYLRESIAAASSGGATGRASRKQANFKGLFTKELKNLMYGFGDDRNPGNDTVNVMEEILVEFITDVCQTAGGPTKKTRLSVEDLRRALSRPADAKKLARMEELLFMQEDIKRARAQFEESDVGQTKAY